MWPICVSGGDANSDADANVDVGAFVNVDADVGSFLFHYCTHFGRRKPEPNSLHVPKTVYLTSIASKFIPFWSLFNGTY